MLYLLSTDKLTIEQYPLTFQQFQRICRTSTPPMGLDENEWDNGGYSGVNGAWAIAETSKPPYDEIEQFCKEATPTIVDGAWTQQWEVTNKSDEQKRQEKYNPGGFLNEIKVHSGYVSWLLSLPVPAQMELVVTAATAKADDNWTELQNFYNGIIIGFPMADAVRGELQEIATNNGILFTF
ncbi:MAG: hypothetical protein HC799_19380 [Limnothrix sp. RL_2_0]|nr:hypothetical protein [Limnothrix sp. RL_2_0]